MQSTVLLSYLSMTILLRKKLQNVVEIFVSVSQYCRQGRNFLEGGSQFIIVYGTKCISAIKDVIERLDIVGMYIVHTW